MSTLLAGGIAVAVAVLGILWRLLSVAKKSGVDQQKAAEGKARDENLKRVQASIDAGDKPVDSLHDPHNRDDR